MQQVRCVHHPEAKAVATGGRCGDFLCEHCLEVPPGYCCRSCRRSLVNKKPDSVSPWLLIFTCLIGCLLVFGIKSPEILAIFSVLVIFIFFAWLRTATVPLGPSGLNALDSNEETNLDSADNDQTAKSSEAENSKTKAGTTEIASLQDPQNAANENEPEHSVLRLTNRPEEDSE